MKEDFLKEETRAEDILLGSVGLGEEASLLSVERIENGYKGVAQWPDGEQFSFLYDDGLDELQLWALGIVEKTLRTSL